MTKKNEEENKEKKDGKEVCLFVWFLNVLFNYYAISRTGPKTERLDNFTCCHTRERAGRP